MADQAPAVAAADALTALRSLVLGFDVDGHEASQFLQSLSAARATLPADDPRNRATVRAVTDELTEDGYVYRFRHDARPMHKNEGAFLLCGFWMAQVAQACGDTTEAARWFERNRAACGPAGLYTEEYDVRQRQSRGNLPQAFVHAGLLECAVRLSAAPGA